MLIPHIKNYIETGNFPFFGYLVSSITVELATHTNLQDYPRKNFNWEISLLLHQQKSCLFHSYSVALICLHLAYPQSLPSYKNPHTSKENIQILTATVFSMDILSTLHSITEESSLVYEDAWDSISFPIDWSHS